MKVEDRHLRQERSISDGFVCLYNEEPCIPFFIGKLLGSPSQTHKQNTTNQIRGVWLSGKKPSLPYHMCLHELWVWVVARPIVT